MSDKSDCLTSRENELEQDETEKMLEDRIYD